MRKIAIITGLLLLCGAGNGYAGVNNDTYKFGKNKGKEKLQSYEKEIRAVEANTVAVKEISATQVETNKKLDKLIGLLEEKQKTDKAMLILLKDLRDAAKGEGAAK